VTHTHFHAEDLTAEEGGEVMIQGEGETAHVEGPMGVLKAEWKCQSVTFLYLLVMVFWLEKIRLMNSSSLFLATWELNHVAVMRIHLMFEVEVEEVDPEVNLEVVITPTGGASMSLLANLIRMSNFLKEGPLWKCQILAIVDMWVVVKRRREGWTWEGREMWRRR
jgi:hypothetical protein